LAAFSFHSMPMGRNCLGNGGLNDSHTRTPPWLRIQTYRDESRSRHFDLIYGSARAKSIDLVSATVASLPIATFACAPVMPFALAVAHLSQWIR
jgi:hypothetical protein